MRAFLVSLVLLGCSGCHDPNAILEKLEAHNDRVTDSDSGSGSGLGSTADTTGDPDTGTTIADPTETGEDDEVTPLLVELKAHTNKVFVAGSVIVRAKIEGPVTDTVFTVNGSPYPWTGEEPLEFIVDSTDYNGLMTFELSVTGGGETEFAKAEVTVSLPETGSVHHRVVDTSPYPTTGKALAILPGSGIEPDTVWAVGNAGDLVRFSRLEGGQLWTSTVADPMEVAAVAVDDEASFFVAGKFGEDLLLRRYRNLGGEWVAIWKRTIKDAVAHDVKVGPDGLIYVAGTKSFEEKHEATLWIVTESGGDVRTETFSAFWNEESLNSEAHKVAFGDADVVMVGALEKQSLNFPMRAAVFTLSNSGLVLESHQTVEPGLETSIWLDVAETTDGWMAVGTTHHPDNPPGLTRGLFPSGLGSPAVALTAGHRGETISWHPGGFDIVAGSRIDANLNPLFYMQGGPWPPYLDHRGVAHDIAVDRHGFTHITGEVVVDGVPHLVWVTVNP